MGASAQKHKRHYNENVIGRNVHSDFQQQAEEVSGKALHFSQNSWRIDDAEVDQR